jgi:hypothetical protein
VAGVTTSLHPSPAGLRHLAHVRSQHARRRRRNWQLGGLLLLLGISSSTRTSHRRRRPPPRRRRVAEGRLSFCPPEIGRCWPDEMCVCLCACALHCGLLRKRRGSARAAARPKATLLGTLRLFRRRRATVSTCQSSERRPPSLVFVATLTCAAIWCPIIFAAILKEIVLLSREKSINSPNYNANLFYYSHHLYLCSLRLTIRTY